MGEMMNKITNKTFRVLQSWLDAQAMPEYIYIAIGDEDLSKGSKFFKMNTVTEEYDTGEVKSASATIHSLKCQCKQCSLKE